MATTQKTRARAAVAEDTPADEPAAQVTVVVPKKYILNADDGKPYTYDAGTQEMPREHAEHWWSVANGVTVYVPDAKK